MMLPGFEDRELPHRLEDRPLPDNVFCYPLVANWRGKVWNFLSDTITDEAKDVFRSNPPEYVVSDDLSWLDDLIFDVTGELTNIKQLTALRLLGEYRAFRAFHATRTNDLSMFYRSGLRIPDNEEIENAARSLFLNGRFPHVSESTLEAAIEDLNGGSFPYRADGMRRLYLCADESDFLTRAGQSGHYLDFGSEYLFNLAVRLVGHHRAKAVLRSVGKPTLLVFDIPMELLSLSTLEDFAGSMLEFLFCELVDDLKADALSPGAGSAMILDMELPPDAIAGHFHPKAFFHSHQ